MVDCTKYETGMDAVAEFAVRNAVGCALQGQFGTVEIAGLIIMTAVGLSMWIRTESIMMPWVVFMMTGSIILPIITAPAIATIMLVFSAVGAAVPLLLYRRMEVRG
jgi:hypothetical protein